MLGVFIVPSSVSRCGMHMLEETRHHGMVQDRLPAFGNGDALGSVDQFKIGEVDV